MVEIIASWFFILLNFLPFAIVCMSKEKHDVAIRKKDEDDSDDEEEEDDK